MKKSNLIRILLLSTVLVMCLPLLSETITVIPTSVQLTINSDVNSNMSRQGDEVIFTVTSSVMQAGKIIINSGSKAYGTVARTEKSGLMGKPGSLAVTVNSVQAVDGSRLQLKAYKYIDGEGEEMKSAIFTYLCIFGFLIKGHPATMGSGYTLYADLIGGEQVLIP
jgi:hypothetical protein